MFKILLPMLGAFVTTELRLRRWRKDDHVASILRDHFNLSLNGQPRRIVESRGKEVWHVTAQDGAFALKLRRAGDGNAILEEAQALTIAGRQYPDVPTFKLMDAPLGTSLLIPWAKGQSMLEACHRRPWKARDLGILFGRRQAELHVMALDDDNDSLIHLDYHPANVITDGDGITAVIDWRNAAIGDPRFDLVRTWLLLRWTMSSRAGRIFYAIPDRAFSQGWWSGYLETRGKPEGMAPFIDEALADMQRGLPEKDCQRLSRYADELRLMVDKTD